MTKKNLRFLKLMLLIMGLIADRNLYAQTINSNSSEAFPILTSGVGPRAIGMGESFSAIADDFSAVYYNPAGLGQIWQPQLFLNHESYLDSGFYETAGFIDPLKAGTLALGFSYINYGDIDLRDANGNLEGTYTPFDMDARGAFGFPLANDLYFGIGTEWARQQITSYVYTALVWNFGFLLKPSSNLSFGLSVQNLGIENLTYGLPTALLGGAAYHIALAPQDAQALLLSAGCDFSFESDSYLNTGAEYTFFHDYFLRAGYEYDIQNEGLGWEKGISFGAGIKVDHFKFDYSFTFDGDLGNVQTVALTAYFPPFQKPTPEPKAVAAPVTVFLPGLPVVVKVVETATPVSTLVNGPTPSPAGALQSQPVETANTGLLSPDDKKPVMLKFQITSQSDLSADELFGQAEDKLKLGLNKDAEDLYLKVLDKDPNFEKAWNRLGRLYFDDSLNSYEHLLQLEPQNLQLRLWIQQFKQN